MMNPRISVQPLQWRRRGADQSGPSVHSTSGEQRYDLFVGTVGYESRASHLLEDFTSSADRFVAATYPENQVHAFERNLRRFREVGEVVDGTDELMAHVHKFVADAGQRDGRRKCRLVVDISSMSRDRLADLVRTIFLDAALTTEMSVDWIYVPAKFNRKLLEIGPVRYNDAIPGFEGWGDPDKPLLTIVGLGLEGNLIYGVLDDVAPMESWAFQPLGVDKRYDGRVALANRSFLSSLAERNLLSYNVLEPFTSFVKLANLLNSLSRNGRVVIVPLGPKVFSLMALILGCAYRQDVAVWRLSADPLGMPADRVASGHEPVGLSTVVGPDPEGGADRSTTV